MKTILITGSTDGIGKLTALKLAKEGHQVLVHGRSEEKLNLTISELEGASKNENIKGYLGDFSSFESVREMAHQIKAQVPAIDVLINNAGVFKSKVAVNEDGLDLRLVVNYLAPFILTHELIPIIKNGTQPRIINLSSAAQSTVDLDALQGKKQVSQQDAYAQSKLALTMWSFHMAKNQSSINVIAVNPGSLLNTKMVNEAYGQYWSSADKGANILYDLSISAQHHSSSGKYFDNDKGAFANAHSDAYDERKISELIDITQTMLLKS